MSIFQSNLFTRRVAKILPSQSELIQLLESKSKIRLYQGFDATGGRLHLGHTIGLRKLMEFADAGHEVIFLFGTGTVLVGDPSERMTGRKLITHEEIEAIIKNWKDQVAPLVDFDKITFKSNGDWLIPLTLTDIIHIASHISAVQLFKRDSFTRRIKAGDTVWFHETLYPLLQGYDSVVMDVDLEIGGTDQEFNMLVGRELQHKINNRNKFVLTTPMIMGTDGNQMSKSSGNCVWLDDTNIDMYGKLMRLPDDQIHIYLENLTNIPLEEIANLPDDPLSNKKRLAYDITQQFHGQIKAQQAADHFQATIQNKQLPVDIPAVNIPDQPISLLNLLSQVELGESNGDRKRLILQGGVEINGVKHTDPQQFLTLRPGDIIKYGKRQFRKII